MGSLTDQQKKIIAVVLVIHLLLVKLTWHDLRVRPDAGVRGRKRLWRVAAEHEHHRLGRLLAVRPSQAAPGRR